MVIKYRVYVASLPALLSIVSIMGFNNLIMNIVRTEQEIWDLLNQCADAEETGGSKYPGMSYEQGIKAAIEWIIGDINDHPIND